MDEQVELKKSITWIRGCAITIGGVLGAGILALPAMVAEMAGPASIISWLLMGLFSVPTVICIGMMSSKYPNSGGMADYVRRGFGEGWGRITGLLILSAMPLGMPITALIGANYLGSIFCWTSLQVHIVAIIILMTAIALNYRGVELSGRVQVGIILVILGILLFTIISSIQEVRLSAFHPFAPNGWVPVGKSMNLLFFAFMGWEMVGHLAEEFCDPHKDIPLSLGTGFVIINILYLSTVFVIIGSHVYQTGDSTTAMVTLIKNRWGANAGVMIAFLGFIICYCTVHTFIAGFSRLVYSEAREGNFPMFLGSIHPVYRSPYIALLSFIPIFIVILSLSWVGSWKLKSLVNIPSTTFLLVYAISMLAAAKVLKSKIGKASACISAGLSVLVLLFSGVFIIYPLIVMGVGVFMVKHKVKQQDQQTQI